MNETKQTPSAFLSLLPLVVLVLMLVATIRAYGSDSLAGASQVTLLVVSAFCVLLGTQFLKVPWAEFEQAITRNVSSVTSAILILLFIGALSGTWMVSGVVPSLILWYEDHSPRSIPHVHLSYQRFSKCHDRQFVDHYCHHWHRPHGYRSGSRI